ncbi:hypothetical protein QBC40DRAFT_324947 [Triangularia verruculosa]|uniref:NmrA-like domain-containing protein n=1 Tax=Triangularia verruculosa TaxID=2587418 RepID=A0AAN7AWN3_9PEZI|nr:hypothetical protein QBC40DRAFT_324947 [Triangularia verruculosa]
MTDRKLLAVFGATGQQGGSVINQLLSTPIDSLPHASQFQLRALTSRSLPISSLTIPLDQWHQFTNSSQPTTTNRTSTIQVVTNVDFHTPSTLVPALENVHTAFVMTTPSFSPSLHTPKNNSDDKEFLAVQNIASAALAQKVDTIIFSTLPSITELSAGKYISVTPFDDKARAEAHLRSLHPQIKSAFVSLGFFMSNWLTQDFLAPKYDEETKGWVMRLHVSGQTKVPLIDAGRDTGKFVAAIMENVERWAEEGEGGGKGRTVLAAEGLYTLDEIADAFSRHTGERVRYEQVSEREVREVGLRGFPESLKDVLVEGYAALEEFGHAGTETEVSVEEGKKLVRECGLGELVTLEEFLAKEGFALGEGSKSKQWGS